MPPTESLVPAESSAGWSACSDEDPSDASLRIGVVAGEEGGMDVGDSAHLFMKRSYGPESVVHTDYFQATPARFPGSNTLSCIVAGLRSQISAVGSLEGIVGRDVERGSISLSKKKGATPISMLQS